MHHHIEMLRDQKLIPLRKATDSLPHIQKGVTLVELIMSIVIIGVALAGILMVINRNVLSSADPMTQDQEVAIAESYLEEILLKDFCDPSNTCIVGNAPGSANCNVCPLVVEASRDLFDNVCDYDGANDLPPKRQDNTNITSLPNYRAQVSVFTNGTLNGLTGANCQVLRVEVTVTGPDNTAYTTTGYRTNY